MDLQHLEKVERISSVRRFATIRLFTEMCRDIPLRWVFVTTTAANSGVLLKSVENAPVENALAGRNCDKLTYIWAGVIIFYGNVKYKMKLMYVNVDNFGF